MSKIFQYPTTPIPHDASPTDLSGVVADVPHLGIRATETTQRFICGTRHITWDGRVFKYSRVTSGGEAYTGQGVVFWLGYIAITSLLADQAAGDSVIYIDAGGAAAVAEDELAGGYVVIYRTDNTDVQQRGIVGNTLADSTGYTRIYLDDPLDLAVTTSNSAETLYNPYSSVKTEQNAYTSVAGIAAANADSLEYLWIQTWGPCWIACGEAGVGGVDRERQLVFSLTALRPHDTTHTVTVGCQHAGFIIHRDGAGTDGPPFVMLQISI